jgi:hypothetical protein
MSSLASIQYVCKGQLAYDAGGSLSCLRVFRRISRSSCRIGEFDAFSSSAEIVRSNRALRLVGVSGVSGGRCWYMFDLYTAARTSMFPN